MVTSTATAVLYHRVSTSEQNPTLARKALRQAAAARGYRVVAELEEVGSGARNDRPKLLEVLELARTGRVKAVVVWKLDRFGRSTVDLLENIRRLREWNVRFVVVADPIEVKPKSEGDAGGFSSFTLTVMAAIAELEREQMRERTRLGLERARAKGVILGRHVKEGAPEGSAVDALRADGASWSRVARELACDVSSARRAWSRWRRVTDPVRHAKIRRAPVASSEIAHTGKRDCICDACMEAAGVPVVVYPTPRPRRDLVEATAKALAGGRRRGARR